jgi:hypothetical protein
MLSCKQGFFLARKGAKRDGKRNETQIIVDDYSLYIRSQLTCVFEWMTINSGTLALLPPTVLRKQYETRHDI